ncbi:major capsid protein [Comamonas sp. 26]|uniref:major capsid protein n=1 Tax=Comamonas sp. 26 TaxID=2035201 RepID=UPI000C4F7EFE|nr:major capsid protein [Comamonas sp. 26]PIG00386.1 virion coat protein B [Comamonas sp. 26]
MGKKLKLALAAVPAFVLATVGTAHAEAVDVTTLVADITGQKASVGSIGLAILGVVLAIVCFNWIRRSIK